MLYLLVGRQVQVVLERRIQQDLYFPLQGYSSAVLAPEVPSVVEVPLPVVSDMDSEVASTSSSEDVPPSNSVKEYPSTEKHRVGGFDLKDYYLLCNRLQQRRRCSQWR